jgi:hypothetical protein
LELRTVFQKNHPVPCGSRVLDSTSCRSAGRREGGAFEEIAELAVLREEAQNTIAEGGIGLAAMADEAGALGLGRFERLHENLIREFGAVSRQAQLH